ncbi:MAG: amidohydrolase family protein, partial [Deltaproteobacteria bacterium]|nr:amidohydrolase family protein [Deltaproteobacteria bacterium]
QNETFAIRGAKVYTGKGAPITDATVVVRGGKIISIGKRPPPAGARVMSGTGKIITPGLVDASTTVGLVEVSQVSEANDGHFNTKSDDKIHAAYRVTDGFNARSVAIPVARSGGVTAVVTSPRGSLIAGQAALVRLTPGAASVAAAPVTMAASLGSRTLGGTPSRGMVIERLRELLDDARTYRRVKGRYDRNQSRRLAAERLDLEALGPVVAGRLPLVIRAHRTSDLRAAIQLKKDLGIDVVIEGGTEAWLLAAELARAKIPVILDPVQNLPYNFDRIHVRPNAATLLDKAGVAIVISTLGSASNVRRLRQLAGNAVANGLPYDRAIEAITSAPARAFGIKSKVGTLERGAPADLVLWSGDPLELSTRPELIMIDGKPVPLRSRQTLLRDRYRQMPARPR